MSARDRRDVQNGDRTKLQRFDSGANFREIADDDERRGVRRDVLLRHALHVRRGDARSRAATKSFTDDSGSPYASRFAICPAIDAFVSNWPGTASATYAFARSSSFASTGASRMARSSLKISTSELSVTFVRTWLAIDERARQRRPCEARADAVRVALRLAEIRVEPR